MLAVHTWRFPRTGVKATILESWAYPPTHCPRLGIEEHKHFAIVVHSEVWNECGAVRNLLGWHVSDGGIRNLIWEGRGNTGPQRVALAQASMVFITLPNQCRCLEKPEELLYAGRKSDCMMLHRRCNHGECLNVPFFGFTWQSCHELGQYGLASVPYQSHLTTSVGR